MPAGPSSPCEQSRRAPSGRPPAGAGTGAPVRRPGALRRGVGATTCLLLSLVLGTVPAAALPSPAPRDVRAAAQDVVAAREELADAEVRGEAAVEAYDGAVVAARRADAALAAARTRASAAARRAAAAQAVSDGAEGALQHAVVLASRAGVEHDQALDDVATARASLDRFAAQAYREGGVGPALSLAMTSDPVSYLASKEILERNGVGLRQSLTGLAAAEATAAGEQRRADRTRHAAGRTVTAAAAATAAARDAGATAQAAEQRARAAEQAAARAAAVARAARARARAAISAARAGVRSAQVTASDLARRAEGARQAAGGVQRRLAAEAPLPTDLGVAPAGSAARVAVAWALREIGVPYSWGGGTASGPSLGVAQGAATEGFDCSGLTAFAYARAGVHLDHWTGSQWTAGLHVDRADLQPGDLVFYAYDVTDPATIHHVGLYVGDGQMVEAPHTGGVVQVSSVDRAGYAGAVRVA